MQHVITNVCICQLRHIALKILRRKGYLRWLVENHFPAQVQGSRRKSRGNGVGTTKFTEPDLFSFHINNIFSFYFYKRFGNTAPLRKR